ncbi:2-Methylcitrate dehydratase AcnD [Rubellimicrobium mesophilum DSM 19309]|uniref:2-Methylcitrate dehydratase AcnD n=1 Tax=Rubellimicrobium mesophilum DSM 19309 TaxID=442562 RepID=A0A017HSK9_9RHOB|nr:2-Methylcitrate dehydratase AcnD [Rubellimicrobium mesophilum DSM 19309]
MGLAIIPGAAEGPVIACEEGLSFWGGVDPATGHVIDAHHPLHGRTLAGAVLALPTSRGSCTGSGVLLELALNAHAPAALVFREGEDVLTLGALVAGLLFGRAIPVLRLCPEDFDLLAGAERAGITETRIEAGPLSRELESVGAQHLDLSEGDRAFLAGESGEAPRLAMEILCAMAAQQGAARLTDVTQVHIDGCIYASPANLTFAERMADMGARVRVPTTMNAISVDRANWERQGTPPDFGRPASRLADAYVRMGARPSFTCAPYLLDSVPAAGEAVGWAESNAVIYANSVLAARTVKHPDFLDLCIALTGRVPLSGVYLDENRKARRRIHVGAPEGHNDAFWPMLGYLAGLLAPDRIPLLAGLEGASPSDDDLKALCAAFGTTSGAPMLHVAGHTPEAEGCMAGDADEVVVMRADLARVWRELNSGPENVDLVAIGSPHVSLSEFRALAALLDGVAQHPSVPIIVTAGRAIRDQARAEGTLARLESWGVQVVTDICWCSISEPVFPPSARVLMTNSGKYAHYAPGLSGRAVRFGSLEDCVSVALTGQAPSSPPAWLA